MHPKSLAVFLGIMACGQPDPVHADCPGGLPQPTCSFETDERDDASDEIERLSEIQRRHQDDVMAIEGVLSMGVGYDCTDEVFVFHIGYDESVPCPATVPANLEGVPALLHPTEAWWLWCDTTRRQRPPAPWGLSTGTKGRHTVNVDPSSGVLSTVNKPPSC